MTVNELYRSFLKEVESIYQRSEAENIVSLVFENIAHLTRAAIIKDPHLLLDEDTITRLDRSLLELKGHKPVQYVLAEAWFYKLRLKVSPAVLIPRPETEELVDMVINYLKDKPGTSLLDIGTGSGCIAIAVKKNLPHVTVTAIDISCNALSIAKENSIQQQTLIDFREINFLDESSWELLPAVEVIVSNPPYIPSAEKKMMDQNVTAFEPQLALFVGDEQPLIFYERIAAFGKIHLKRQGKIFMETHEAFAGQVAALFENDHYSSAIANDISGKQRMVIATLRSR